MRWLAMAALILTAGCKPEESTAARVGEMKAEEILAHLRLTGLVQGGAEPSALILLAVPGQPTEHLKLRAGQRTGDLEITRIDLARRTVDVRLGDLAASLSLLEDGVSPDDGYAWLQRLTPDEHARIHNSPARQELVDDHSRAHEERQRQELARELEERDLSSPETPSEPSTETP